MPHATEAGQVALPVDAGSRRLQGLLAQVAWFNRLRTWAALGIAVAAAVVGSLLGALESAVPLYVLAAIALLLNACYRRYYPRLTEREERHVRRHVDVQIAGDLLLLTAALHFAGGVTNPFVLFYLFHTFIAALLLSARAAVLVATLSVVLLSGLAFGEYLGWLEHRETAIGWFRLAESTPARLTAALLGFAATLGCSVYFFVTVASQLRQRERVLVQLSRQLAQSEKLASVGTLAAGVSHEINNPTSVIQTRAKILRYRIEDGDSAPALLAEVDAIDKHVRRIGAITAGLLAFARSTPFELQVLDINDLLDEVADLVRIPFENAGVVLRCRTAGAAVPAAGSANHLLQVLVNVLLNARDASPRGATVWLESALQDGAAVISVRDEGHGIAPEHLDQVFDPFFTTKDVDKGTGLGLAITHGLVERHGGRIEIASAPAEGTTVTIRLPATAAG